MNAKIPKLVVIKGLWTETKPRYLLIPSKRASIRKQKQKVANADEDREIRNYVFLVDVQNGTSDVVNSKVIPPKIRNRIIIYSEIQFLGKYAM